MKPHLPVTLLTALACALGSAEAANIKEPEATAKTSGTVTYGSAKQEYKTENGTVTSTVTGDWSGYMINKTNCQEGCFRQDKEGIVTAMPDEYVSEDGKPRYCTNTNLTIGGTDENGNAIVTKANRVSAAGISGHIVTGNKTVTVKDGAEIGVLSGSYDLENKDKGKDGYGHHCNAMGGNSDQSIKDYAFPTKAAEGSKITMNIEGGTVVEAYSIYVSSNAVDKELRVLKNSTKYENATEEERAEMLENVAWESNEEVTVNITGGSTNVVLAGGFNGKFNTKTTVNMKDGNAELIYGGGFTSSQAAAHGFYASVKGTEINMSGGKATAVYGGANGNKAHVLGDTHVNVSGGEVEFRVAGGGWASAKGSTISGSTNVKITNNAKVKNISGGGEYNTIQGDANITVDGENVMVTGDIVGAGKGDTIEGDLTVKLLDGKIDAAAHATSTTGKVKGHSLLEVGRQTAPLDISLRGLTGFNDLIIHRNSHIALSGSNVMDSDRISLTVNQNSIDRASITLTDNAYVSMQEGPITFNITLEGNLVVDKKYQIIDATAVAPQITDRDALEGWNTGNVTVEGGYATFDDLIWEDGLLYLLITQEMLDKIEERQRWVSNWGVFKSSHAFTATLWGPRSNAVLLSHGKWTEELETRTIAWATAYNHSSRISGDGADYSFFGGAIGIEHYFDQTGRYIGLGFGYDTGKVKPFCTTDVDQDMVHAALYGRVKEWKAGRNGQVVLDLSVAYGYAESSHDSLSRDWQQDSWQFNARTSYLRAFSERTTGSAFVEAEYYTQDEAKVDGVIIDSLDNARLSAGTGISHEMNRLTVYGEIALHYDIMRHNPRVITERAVYEGTNPGRFGGHAGVGVSYRVRQNVNVFGNYTFSGAQSNTEHNLNIGASVRF